MWQRINKFVYSHTVLSTVLISMLFVFLIAALGISILNMELTALLVLFTVGQLLLTTLIIWFMRRLQVFSLDDFKTKGMGKGFLLAWVGLVIPIIQFIYVFLETPSDALITPNPLLLIIVILHPLVGTGLFEEVLYRGLILKILLKKMGHSKRGIIKSCIISSAIFGLLHAVNIFAYDTILPVIGQIIVAFAIGFFLAVVFLRTGRLWIPIILHAILNLSGQIFTAFIPYELFVEQMQADVSVADIPEFVFLTLLVAISFLVAGLVLLRKVMPDEITEKDRLAN